MEVMSILLVRNLFVQGLGQESLWILMILLMRNWVTTCYQNNYSFNSFIYLHIELFKITMNFNYL